MPLWSLLLVAAVWCTPTLLQHVFMRSGSLIDETKASAVNDRISNSRGWLLRLAAFFKQPIGHATQNHMYICVYIYKYVNMNISLCLLYTHLYVSLYIPVYIKRYISF